MRNATSRSRADVAGLEVAALTDRAAALAARFQHAYGTSPRIYRAPGRVNLIGEHTDYNDGFVLPVAIDASCWVAAAPHPGRTLAIESVNVAERAEWNLAHMNPSAPRWSRYVGGVAAILQRRGVDVPAATLLIRSDVPIGAGLSSSAALEVGVATALTDLAGVTMAPLALARLCQEAEIEFAGARCGIMDQFVAVHAHAGHALRLDCRSLQHRLVPLPSDVRLVACDTTVRHAHAGGEYNNRRAACEDAVARIAAHKPRVRSLRDVDLQMLETFREELGDVLYRRCRHVVTENERVVDAVRALEANDLGALGRLMADSHRSLRDDYEVSCAELDAMVESADGAPGCLGARMTGGGFGGCTVNVVRTSEVDAFRAHVTGEYARRTGRAAEVYVTDAGSGAGRVL
jgi:galactokinase